jgi:lactoylglutathione lyase
MISHVPVRRLFETHLTVSDLQRSVSFYRDQVGLTLALEVPERNAAFFWVGEAGDSLLGLWSLGSSPLGITLHVAFEVPLNDLLDASKRLEAQDITPLSFFGAETREPSVIGWMPAAALYFRDPDGHLLEYLAILEEDPKPDSFLVRVACSAKAIEHVLWAEKPSVGC